MPPPPSSPSPPPQKTQPPPPNNNTRSKTATATANASASSSSAAYSLPHRRLRLYITHRLVCTASYATPRTSYFVLCAPPCARRFVRAALSAPPCVVSDKE
ncbi:hypothetical protein DPMN_162135 [Dreissena polymorpha]|uniref:Uncharacterized protein n=1 Tax=Dreissena polymorpha TaxID=45954 RepID=A0A9D4ERR1_DREPO|nr:hypothetical protein DPMN_162135 [Dreissena polymorpha]